MFYSLTVFKSSFSDGLSWFVWNHDLPPKNPFVRVFIVYLYQCQHRLCEGGPCAASWWRTKSKSREVEGRWLVRTVNRSLGKRRIRWSCRRRVSSPQSAWRLSRSRSWPATRRSCGALAGSTNEAFSHTSWPSSRSEGHSFPSSFLPRCEQHTPDERMALLPLSQDWEPPQKRGKHPQRTDAPPYRHDETPNHPQSCNTQYLSRASHQGLMHNPSTVSVFPALCLFHTRHHRSEGARYLLREDGIVNGWLYPSTNDNVVCWNKDYAYQWISLSQAWTESILLLSYRIAPTSCVFMNGISLVGYALFGYHNNSLMQSPELGPPLRDRYTLIGPVKDGYSLVHSIITKIAWEWRNSSWYD